MRTLAALALAALAAAPAADPGRLEAGPADGSLRVHVAKRGAFSMFAHDHDFEVTRWSATARLPEGDPARAAIEVVLSAGSLRDRQRKLSDADRRKVDAQAAGPEVLDAGKFPEITWRAERATLDAGGEGGQVRGTLHGELTVRGRTRPVDAAFEAARQGGGWTVRGKARFPQSAFGIRPFRGFGGTVGVKDEVEVSFAFTLRPR
ncbi:MAG TPA: YceI family protein [Anaeromyxobacter sp.]|nr:YceI family protein [Anaeromyxobacter sp.]